MPSPARVAAKYKEKKKVPKADGSGETTVYVYSEAHNRKQDKAKAKRIEALRRKIKDVRKKAKKDLSSNKAKERLAALAVLLMDSTFERVGNPDSAKEGRFGVTTWQKKHVTVSGNKVTFKYVGKSGVSQDKSVTDAKLAGEIKKLLKGKKPGDRLFCDDEAGCVVSASDVNKYLKDFAVTAKDIRGMHANEQMKKQLSAVRKKGPAIPKDKKEREALLKEEFKQALELAAASVGHEPSTLKNQYLVPGMVDDYLKDGKIMNSLVKKGSLQIKWMTGQEIFKHFGDRWWTEEPVNLPRGHSTMPFLEGMPYWQLDKFDGYSDWDKSARYMTAWDGDRAVAAVKVYTDPKFKRELNAYFDATGKPKVKGDVWALAYLTTHRDYRRKGLASQLYDAVIDRMPPGSILKLGDPQPDGQKFQLNWLKRNQGNPKYNVMDTDRRYDRYTYDPSKKNIAFTDVRYWEVPPDLKRATLSVQEKEERENERLIKPSPKKKPPRSDRTRRRIKDQSEGPSAEEKAEEKDRRVGSSSRVALRWLFAKGSVEEFLKQEGDKPVKNPDTGREVKLRSISRAEEGSRAEALFDSEYEKWKGEGDPEKDPSKKEDSAEEEPAPPSKEELVDRIPEGPGREVFTELSDEDAQDAAKEFERVKDKIAGEGVPPDEIDAFEKEVAGLKKKLGDLSPKELGRALAKIDYHERVVDNPLVDVDDPLPDGLEAVDDKKNRQAAYERALKAREKYSEVDAETRTRHAQKIQEELVSLSEDDPRRPHLEAMQKGLGVAAVLEEGDEATGVGASVARLIKAAERSGNLDRLLKLGSFSGEEAPNQDDQVVIRDMYEGLRGEEFLDVVDEDHPMRPLAELLGDSEKGKFLDDSDRNEIRGMIADALVGEFAFIEPAVNQGEPKATVGEKKKESLEKRKQAVATLNKKPPSNFGDFKRAMTETKDWLADFLRQLARGKKASRQMEWDFSPWDV